MNRYESYGGFGGATVFDAYYSHSVRSKMYWGAWPDLPLGT